MPGLIQPDKDRDADVASRTLTERDDLRRKVGWLFVVFVVITLISISGLTECNNKQASDDTDAQAVPTAMLDEPGPLAS